MPEVASIIEKNQLASTFWIDQKSFMLYKIKMQTPSFDRSVAEILKSRLYEKGDPAYFLLHALTLSLLHKGPTVKELEDLKHWVEQYNQWVLQGKIDDTMGVLSFNHLIVESISPAMPDALYKKYAEYLRRLPEPFQKGVLIVDGLYSGIHNSFKTDPEDLVVAIPLLRSLIDRIEKEAHAYLLIDAGLRLALTRLIVSLDPMIRTRYALGEDMPKPSLFELRKLISAKAPLLSQLLNEQIALYRDFEVNPLPFQISWAYGHFFEIYYPASLRRVASPDEFLRYSERYPDQVKTFIDNITPSFSRIRYDEKGIEALSRMAAWMKIQAAESATRVRPIRRGSTATVFLPLGLWTICPDVTLWAASTALSALVVSRWAPRWKAQVYSAAPLVTAA